MGFKKSHHHHNSKTEQIKHLSRYHWNSDCQMTCVLLLDSIFVIYLTRSSNRFNKYAIKLNQNARQTRAYPDSKVHGANMGPAWVLSPLDRPHVGPMNLAIRDTQRDILCIVNRPGRTHFSSGIVQNLKAPRPWNLVQRISGFRSWDYEIGTYADHS